MTTRTEEIMILVKLGLDIAREIIQKILDSDDISQLRVGELNGWRQWEQEKVKPNMKKLLEEYRKVHKKGG